MKLLFWRKSLYGACFNGVYLPAPDDPRWQENKNSKDWLSIGRFHVHRTLFYIQFHETKLGRWKRYARTVEKAFTERSKEKLSLSSLAELENAT